MGFFLSLIQLFIPLKCICVPQNCTFQSDLPTSAHQQIKLCFPVMLYHGYSSYCGNLAILLKQRLTFKKRKVNFTRSHTNVSIRIVMSSVYIAFNKITNKITNKCKNLE